ncbi:MAG: primosomal protein N', partial [Bacteroidetes bacterium]
MEEFVAVGCRIVVPFGKTKILTAIIHGIHESPPKNYEAKYILDILEETPSINEHQLTFFEWLADYYLCTLGEVIQAALPSGLKINTSSYIQRSPYFEEEDHVLSIEEQLVMQQLAVDKPIELAKLGDLLGQTSLSKVLKALSDKEAILLIDHIKEKFIPKIKKFVRLSQYLVDSEMALETVINQLEKKPRQQEVLMAYLRSVPVLEDSKANQDGLELNELVSQGCSASSIKTLESHSILEIFDKEVPRFAT